MNTIIYNIDQLIARMKFAVSDPNYRHRAMEHTIYENGQPRFRVKVTMTFKGQLRATVRDLARGRRPIPLVNVKDVMNSYLNAPTPWPFTVSETAAKYA